MEEAVESNVKPEMSLFVDDTTPLYEILRQFWGTKPNFTYIGLLKPIALDLVHCGLIKKLIASNVQELYPTPGLSHVLNRVYKEKQIELELCSFSGINQRLLAGAIGTGFIPTRSMIGTSMAEENNDSSYKVIDDPFGSGNKLGIMKAINPDLTIIHCWAADRYGNAILPPFSLQSSEYGAWASKNVMLTVEKLVSTAFIREHSPLVKIPGYMVNSVSVIPMGMHPDGMIDWGMGIKEFEPYCDDYEFLTKHREASRTPETLDAWLKEWVLDCHHREDYLSKLGHDKISSLKGRADSDIWEYQLISTLNKVPTSMECTQVENMIVAVQRKIKERILAHNYKVMLTGIGASALAGWIAYYQLKKEGYEIAIVMGSGQLGLAPRAGDPFLMNVSSLRTAKIQNNTFFAYPVIVNGANRKSISILSAGQIDKFGNLNSAKISDDRFLAGPGGAGDAYQACEVVAVIEQEKARFVENVPYITSNGAGVKTLVSTLGVFEKLGEDDEFTLTACLPHPNFPSLKEKIENVRLNCGWELKVAQKVEEISPPSFEELMILRLIDPDDYFRH